MGIKKEYKINKKKYIIDVTILIEYKINTLMKVRTRQAEVTSLKPYLEHFSFTCQNLFSEEWKPFKDITVGTK